MNKERELRKLTDVYRLREGVFLGSHQRASGAPAILYCGDTGLYEQWQQHCSTDASVLDYHQLHNEASAHAHQKLTIVLSLNDTSDYKDALPRNVTRRSTTPSAVSPAQELFETLQSLQKLSSHFTIILLTHNGIPLDLCCEAVRLGVMHFVDVDAEAWEKRLRELLDASSRGSAARHTESPQELLDTCGIRAISPAMQKLIVHVHRGAQVSDATVLIHGESGTGKQLLAEAVHRLDPKRSRQMFVPVNCAAITGTLAESELFGHSRGAFSGATENRLGYFRTANKGTIFLDEISELPLHLQPKLLRVLQERRVMPVGSDKEEAIDVRVIAATNVSLQEKVAKGEFRLDLYQRLNVIQLTVPPLRQRTEDIPLLVQHFLTKYAHYYIQPILDVNPRVYELLKRKAGSGNVRELENIIRQSLVFKSEGNCLELQDLPRHLFEAPDEVVNAEVISSVVAENLVALIRSRRLTLKQAVESFEKTLIKQAAHTSPDISKVELAKVLGLPRRTLYYKLDAE